MITGSLLNWILGIILVGLAVFLLAYYFSPLCVIVFYNSVIKRKKRQPQGILAVDVKPKIRIVFHKCHKERSLLIGEIKSVLKKLASQNGNTYRLEFVQQGESENSKRSHEEVIIPDDDIMEPDMQIEDREGPMLNEEDSAERDDDNPDEYINLKDL